VKPLIGKQIKPRSRPRRGFNRLGVGSGWFAIWSLRGAGVSCMPASGGAFSQFSCWFPDP